MAVMYLKQEKGVVMKTYVNGARNIKDDLGSNLESQTGTVLQRREFLLETLGCETRQYNVADFCPKYQNQREILTCFYLLPQVQADSWYMNIRVDSYPFLKYE